MVLEALKRYAEEQNQATQKEVSKLIDKTTKEEKKPSNIKPSTNKENVIEALQQRLAGEYKRLANNTRLSEQLRVEIYKGVKAGTDHTTLLLKALECISLMTGDTVLYNQNADIIKNKAHSNPEQSGEN